MVVYVRCGSESAVLKDLAMCAVAKPKKSKGKGKATFASTAGATAADDDDANDKEDEANAVPTVPAAVRLLLVGLLVTCGDGRDGLERVALTMVRVCDSWWSGKPSRHRRRFRAKRLGRYGRCLVWLGCSPVSLPLVTPMLCD